MTVGELIDRGRRKILARVASIPRVRRRMKRAAKRSIAVLMYHGVTEYPLPTFHWCQLRARCFAEQLDVLDQARYQILPLSEVVDRLETTRPLPDFTACLTFDDGLRNVRSTAFPLLESRGLPATVFLITDLVGTNQPAWPDQLYHALMVTEQRDLEFEGKQFPLGDFDQRSVAHQAIVGRLKVIDDDTRRKCTEGLIQQTGEYPVPHDSPLATLGWDEISELQQTGLIEFGAHTATHPILSRCRLEVQESELRRSHDVVRDRVGGVALVAYPNGSRADYTDQTCRLAQSAGFKAAVTTVIGLHRVGASLFEMRRVPVGADTDLAAFERGLLGF